MKNEYKISHGNLQVLQLVPEMLLKDKWKDALRHLVLDYITEKILKKEKKDDRY